MSSFRKGMAALLCAALCAGAGCAAADRAQVQADWERLERFVIYEYGAEEEKELPTESVSAETFAEKRNYAKVEVLYLYGLDQEQLEAILSKARKLRRLDLRNCAVEDFSPLLRMQKLATVSLFWEEVEPERLAALDNVPEIIINEIPDGADLSPLAEMRGIKRLYLDFQEGVSVGDLRPLGELPKLRRLELHYAEKLFHTLPDMPVLEEFLPGWEIDLALLKHAPKLQTLYLQCGDTTDLRTLASLPALKELYILREMPGDLTPLHTLTKLKYLSIDAVNIDLVDYVEPLEALHEAAPKLKIVAAECC